MNTITVNLEEHGFGYQHSFYKSNELPYFAAQMLAKLPKEVNLLVSGGSSGCAIASSILTLASTTRELSHHSVYTKGSLRHRHKAKIKKEEGSGIFCPKGNLVIAFVDDLIESGTTFMSVYRYVNAIFGKPIEYAICIKNYGHLVADKFNKIDPEKIKTKFIYVYNK